MFGKALQLTLRRMQTVMRRPTTLVTLAAVAVALGVSGPFGTYEQFAIGPRFAFWAVMVFATFAAGFFGGNYVMNLVAPRAGYFVTVPLAGVASGVPVTLVVIAVTATASPGIITSPLWAIEMLIYCVAISTGIAAVFAAFKAAPETRPVQSPQPRLIERLPVTERGDLVSLSVSDHYVEVVTIKGKTLLLMRLSDAIAETDGVKGVQIHRSHWVALDQVNKVHRTGGKISVETSAGTRLPISRGFLPAAREAGLVT